jgi:large subunit ribosomal protein L10
MTQKAVANIPKRKLNVIKDLKNLFSNKKTVLICSIKNIPASQFQEISKKLRGKAIVRVPKKSLVFRAIDEFGNEKAIELKQNIDENFALLFSDLDTYELSTVLTRNKTPSKAKVGQEAPFDIEIPAGPTDLVPGPAISELGALGIQIQIKDGKIEIKTPKIIAKKGEKIKQGAADLMSKLDIKPFSVGFTPLVALDTEINTIYTEIKIDKEGTLTDLKYAASRALPFAVEIGYISEDTIKFMISKAGAQEKKLIRVITGEPEPVVAEEPAAEKKDAPEEKKEEEKAPAAAGLGALFG